METVERVLVTAASGVAGDHKGRVIPGRLPRRQVTLLARADWDAALAECGASLGWEMRRANLLVEGLALPRGAGTVIAIGPDLRLAVTCETNPCFRMDEIHPGLQAALTPDWRGGICTRVLTDGEIAVGDDIRIER